MDRLRLRLPWLLVAGSALLVVLLLYAVLGALVPAKQRVARLEAELKDVYAREAALQTRLAQQEQRHAAREGQVGSLTAERDSLTRRVEELQRELAAARRRK